MSTADTLPDYETGIWHDLLADIAPAGALRPVHTAAARVVTDPHTIKQIRLHDDAVNVEAVLRRKDWQPGEEAGEVVQVPLARVPTYLSRFEVLEIGATTHPRRPILMDAISFEIANGSVYSCVCIDHRGLGAMITSNYRLTTGTRAGQTFGTVIGRAAARSGTDGANERRRLAMELLNREYGASPKQATAKGADVAFQAMALAIVEHFVGGAVGCTPPVHLWLILCNGVLLARSPAPEKERSPAGVLADKINAELSITTYGATRAEYPKARQWQIHYDESFDPDEDEEEGGKRPPAGIVGPQQIRLHRDNFGAPADVLGIRLADDDMWPSELISLMDEDDDRFTWPELLGHLIGLRTKLSLTDREAKFLFMLEQGYRQNEIARRTGWHESTVSRDLKRAGRQLIIYQRSLITP